jgi:DUF1365 family protein
VATKSLPVSPFMTERLDYGFTLTRPGRTLAVHITASAPTAEGALFDATLSLRWRPWSAAAIRRTLWQFPFMTTRVIAAIHYEALRLWWKGVPLVPRSPSAAVSQALDWPPYPINPEP